MNIRQSIVIRTDLGFPVGLLCAQVAHIHMKFIQDLDHNKNISSQINNEIDEWLKSPYLFVHQVPNLESLMYFYELSKGKTKCNIWKDTVYVKVSDKQSIALKDTPVGFSLGPDDSDTIRSILGDLPLL